MELRRSVRGKSTKRVVVSSDEEEEVLTKKTRLTAKGTYKEVDQLSTENYGIGKRIRKKNVMYQNYKLFDDDSDSDYESHYTRRKRSSGRKERVPKMKEMTKIELLLDWKREFLVNEAPKAKESFKVVNVKKVIDSDLKQYGSDLQALFINIKWQTKYVQDGVRIEDFKKLDLNKKLMKNGIVFIWSQKEILGKLFKIMEEKGFFYIENFVIALLDASKADSEAKEPEEKNKVKVVERSSRAASKKKIPVATYSDSSSTTESPRKGKNFQEDDLYTENEYFLQNLQKYPNVQADQVLHTGESEYLRNSKRVLMMFRRTDPQSGSLELRHQRTCDALFDLVNHKVPYGASDSKSKEYVYKLIETLLPKALYNPSEKKLKMMEIWGDSTAPREGWINVCEKN